MKTALLFDRRVLNSVIAAFLSSALLLNSAVPLFAVASPRTASSFIALDDDNSAIPAGPSGAVGPSHVMTVANTQYRIQARSGDTISTVSADSFWAGLGAGLDVFGSRIAYDTIGRRWLIAATANPGGATSALLFGASNTTDPTGTWSLYRMDSTNDGITGTQWIDVPSLGFNKTWAVIAANVFDGTTWQRSQVWALDKADLYAAAATVDVRLMNDATNRNLVPAVTYDSDLAPIFLVARLNAATGSIRIRKIDGAIGAETLTDVADLTSGSGGWSVEPAVGSENFAPQLGSAEKIHIGDDRIQSVVYRKPESGTAGLWVAHTIFLPTGGTPTTSALQWWEINMANPTVPVIRQNARLGGTTSSKFYAFPSLCANKDGDMMIGYSRFGADQYPSANYAFRFNDDTLNTLRDDTVLKDGEGSYFKNLTGTLNRWGNYSSTVVEPGNDFVMWTLQQYAALPVGVGDDSGRFSTWWGQIVPSDLAVTLTTNRQTVGLNKDITYTCTITNLGSKNFTGVKASVALPSSASMISASAPAGSCAGSGCDMGTITSFGSGATSSASMTLIARPTSLGSITTTAGFTANEADRNSVNNSASVTTAVGSSANVYPNPWRPSSTSGQFASASGACGNGLIFDSLVADTKIRIYNVQGDLIRDFTIAPADNGCKSWDGKNDSGDTIASGIYLAVIKSPSGDEDVRKIAVEK